MKKNTRGINITEFVILLFIIGVLSGLTLNNFFRAVQQTLESEAIIQIQTIQKHVQTIIEITGTHPSCALTDLISINDRFKLQIPNNNYLSYQYIPTANYYILEVLTARGWGIRYNSRYSRLGFHCVNGPCPSCKENGKNCGN